MLESCAQESSWSCYYDKIGEPSWMDMIASAIYNGRYLFQIIRSRPRSILEVGTGRGLHSIVLSHFAPRVIGIDVEGNTVRKAIQLNEKLKGRAEFLKMDAFNLGFDDQSFSVCCSQGFFEHFPNSDILALVKEQLRVGRLVVFSVPSCYYPERNLGNERLMSLQDWEEMMTHYLVTGFYYGPTVDTSEGFFGNIRPNALKKALSAPGRAQICVTVREL